MRVRALSAVTGAWAARRWETAAAQANGGGETSAALNPAVRYVVLLQQKPNASKTKARRALVAGGAARRAPARTKAGICKPVLPVCPRAAVAGKQRRNGEGEPSKPRYGSQGKCGVQCVCKVKRGGVCAPAKVGGMCPVSRVRDD